MHAKTVLESAELIRRAYAGSLPFVGANAEPGAQAYMTRDRDLVIPGTNEREDWRFNLDLKADHGVRIPGLALVPQSDIGSWHFGFLRHADSVYRFARVYQPRFIVGHSLGGAAAQIIGARIGVPTVTFGAPRVYRGRLSRLPHENWVLNLCRTDDPTVNVPPRFIFRHLGSVRRLRTGRPQSRFGHGIANYIEMLSDRDNPLLASVERQWPRVA